MAKNKCYVVWAGHKTGLFHSWAETQTAKSLATIDSDVQFWIDGSCHPEIDRSGIGIVKVNPKLGKVLTVSCGGCDKNGTNNTGFYYNELADRLAQIAAQFRLREVTEYQAFDEGSIIKWKIGLPMPTLRKR